jgi:hypothetical protein
MVKCCLSGLTSAECYLNVLKFKLPFRATEQFQGKCPGCMADVIAKCGERKINHWAHKKALVCDPWWRKKPTGIGDGKIIFLKPGRKPPALMVVLETL